MKIRIFALAKELNLDSKDLIQACTEVGLNVKSSPLASISPEERDRVLAHMKSRKSAPVKGPEAPASPRDLVPERVKPKPIRQLAPVKGRRDVDDEQLDSVFEDEAPPEEVVVETTPEPEVAPLAPEPVVEVAPALVLEPVPPATGEAPQSVITPDVVPEPPVPPATPAEPSAVIEVSTPVPGAPRRSSPITRSDYVAPGGGMREMKPVGSIRDSQPRSGQAPRTPGAAPPPISRDRGPRKPALPTMALPNFKAPAPTKVEGPVQKPDFKLTGEMIRDSGKGKIAEIMRKNKETGTKKPGQAAPLTAEEIRKGKSTIGGMEEIREARRQKRTKSRGEDGDVLEISRQQKRAHRRSVSTELKSEATIKLPMTMRGFSEALGRPAGKLIGIAMKAGKMPNINDPIDEELALEIAMELGIDLKIEHEDDVETELREWLDRPNEDFGVPLLERPPIITILGHVDHGKTTLVDKIRSSNVAAGEAGGITQHIAAYQVEHHGKRLTFLDTPGHAAFGAMRSRGANATDIIVLVVAANDGVMPQTVECIAHAKAAGVPIVVALNKIDLPGINEQKVLTELSQQGLYPTEWGGDVEVVRISALNGTGIDNLLETLLLTSELTNYTAPTEIAADGICLEAFRDEGRGPMAWCIVRRGTLKIGDTLLCGATYGHVRAMYDDRGREVKEAGPSMPVKIAGLTDVPGAGQHFFAVDDLDLAVQVAKERRDKGRADMLARRGGTRTLEEFFAHRDGTLRELPLIIKADTQGSIEAIRHELEKFDHPEVRIRILHEAVGGVNESDVYLAASSGAIIVAFHIAPDENAISLAGQEEVEIRRYTIIYNVADDIRQSLEGLLSPEVVTVQTGRALVLRTFSNSKVGTIAGCRVLSGLIERSSRVNVIRDQKILNDYAIGSLRREKEDVREVRDGLECGIKLEGFNDIKEGDLLECFRIEHRKRTLDL
ncbi:MAG: translation initiation factor IF-2 [Planctomycetota bacterium]|nr:MAG: translation initiation factor IF-2 [Planctomycetota bacterium]